MERLLGPALILILCAVLECVLPSGAGKKAFRVLCAVVVFASVCSSFRGFDLSDFMTDSFAEDIIDVSIAGEAQAEKGLLIAAETGSRNAAAEALRNAGIPFDTIKAVCAAAQDSLLVQSVTVVGALPSDVQRIQTVLQPLFDPTTEIIVPEKEAS